MSVSILGSVGKLGKNNVDDVVKVQHLLAQHGMPVGRADGLCGPRTIGAIHTFQAGFLRQPDGLVEPGGKTLQRLNLISFKPAVSNKVAPKVVTPQEVKKAVPAAAGTSLIRLVRRDTLGPLNPGLKAVSNQYMLEKLGKPRESFSQACQPVTNEKLKKYITTASVGPFKVTGLKPAVDSLRTIMAEIAVKQPEVYQALGSAGMLCARNVRGSTTAISNHSWGTAIDLKLNGALDGYGDGMVQYGLTLIAPIFNAHGWYWGVAFRKEDAMHFEVSRSLLEKFLPDIK
ncbi:M15 family metallopeptidase [Massilia sp. W12]|uniref:M15 family metallopeptidase n=1 Tax=Massilia sp. W12 TaxID=3126507 RepID=UPI0030CBADAF